MTTTETANLSLARRAIAAIADGATGDPLKAFFHDDVVQEEFPNPMAPRGATRTLPAILASAESGKRVMRAQTWTIASAVAEGDLVAMELEWTGVLAIPLGDLPAGHELRARVAAFMEIRDGRIIRQRNYDCYLP
jgi:ketosteroid isomerase-like protein